MFKISEFEILSQEQLMRIYRTEEISDPNEKMYTQNKKKISTKKSHLKQSTASNSSRTKPNKSPRISFFKQRTGKLVKSYRCLTCPSFVRANQPQCYTCLGVPHAGGKKVKNDGNVNKKATNKIDKKETVKIKSVDSENVDGKSTLRTKPILQSNKNRKRKAKKEPARVPCVYCFRRTKCKDGICMTCKSDNQASGSNLILKSSSNDEKQVLQFDVDKSFKKQPVLKIQSFLIKPSDEKGQSTRPTTSFKSTQQSEMRVSTTSTVNEVTTSADINLISEDDVESNVIKSLSFNLKENSDEQLPSIVSDLENLLSAPVPDTEPENDDNFYVSINDINNIMSINYL